LEEAFLHEIIHVVVVVDHSVDDGPEQRMMAPMQGRKRLLIALLDALHELFVSRFPDSQRDAVVDVLVIEGMKHGVGLFRHTAFAFPMPNRFYSGGHDCRREKVSEKSTPVSSPRDTWTPDFETAKAHRCGVFSPVMDAEPDISWARVAAFVRQHTHDVRNDLNSIGLETALVEECLRDDEGRASLQRLRRQLRSLGDGLRSLAALFQDPQPVAAPIPAHDLFLIWQEMHAALPNAPAVQWRDELDDEKVSVDVEMLATVFRELLVSAAGLTEGDSLTVAARVTDGKVVFELREPKREELDAGAVGQTFSTTRPGRCDLRLWAARGLVEANGGMLERRQLPKDGLLITQIVFPVV